MPKRKSDTLILLIIIANLLLLYVWASIKVNSTKPISAHTTTSEGGRR